MSRVYLGRIADITGLRDRAVEQYRAALAVRGLPDRARALAMEGLARPFGPSRAPAAPQAEDDDYDHEAAAWGEEGEDDEDAPAFQDPNGEGRAR